jgi:DNA-directed RNA polymerase subunit RPC12/RpoP
MAEYEYNGQEEKKVDTDFIKCEACGSKMTFDPNTQKLVCGHCGHTEQFEKNSNVKEIELTSALQMSESWESETKVYKCENCGAKVVIEKNVVAGSCPFCGTAHVVETDEIAGIKPNALIPFLLDDSKAVDNCKKWSKRRIFAPSSFKKSFKPENIKGVYTPCFTFDSNTVSVYNGRLGERRTRTVGSGKNRRTETYIHWYNVSGNMQYFFDDILIAAGKKISQKQISKISPFVREKSCVYETKFLHGFVANHYDKDIKTSWQEAKGVIDQQIRSMIMRKHHADVVDYLNVSTNHHNVTYKYMLMPVYVGNFTFHKKLYNLYVNGSTGKVYGKAPVSPIRVGLLVIIIAAIIALFAIIANKASSGDNDSYIYGSICYENEVNITQEVPLQLSQNIQILQNFEFK